MNKKPALVLVLVLVLVLAGASLATLLACRLSARAARGAGVPAANPAEDRDAGPGRASDEPPLQTSNETSRAPVSPDALAAARGEPVPGPEPPRALDAFLAALEQCARDCDSFHSRAWPVIQRMRAVCRGPSELATVRGVLANAGRSDEVRGAVLLAGARLLGEEEFSALFRSWIEALGGAYELARAAALAADQRGSPSGCALAVDVADLAALPLVSDVAPPGLYPARLQRLVADDERDVLLDLLRSRAPGFQPERAAREDLEIFTTRSVCRLVLAHNALVDADAGDYLLESLAERDAASPLFLTTPAAFLALHSLAPCSDDWQARFDRWTDDPPSGDEIGSELAGLMRGLGVGMSGDRRLDSIESRRRAADPTVQVEQLTALFELAEDARELVSEGGDAFRERLVEVGTAIALDPEEDDMVRLAALDVVGASGDEEGMLHAAQLVLAYDPVPANRIEAVGLVYGLHGAGARAHAAELLSAQQQREADARVLEAITGALQHLAGGG